MADTAVAGPNSEFEFNPSAPEFVPQELQERPLYLPSVRLAAGAAGGAGGAEEKDGRGAPSRRRPAAAAAAPAARGTAVDSEKLRRQAARRATTAPETPSQVATLVVKNLAMDLEKADILRFLEERGAAAADVDLHRDATGAFRGTAFARYPSPGKARAALEKLGTFPEFGGRKARIEIQKSKALFGRKCLEAGLPQEELGVVREEIECFVNDPSRSEVGLPAGLTVQQRKYAHSLAERHNLVHATRQGESGEKFVYLSKARGTPLSTRKKAHSVANCTGSRHSIGGNQGGKARRQALSADEFSLASPPGVELELMPAYLIEPKLSGELLNDEAIFASEVAASAALMTPSPLVGAAPGLPLPPGLELEGLAALAALQALPPPSLVLPPKGLDLGSPALGPNVAAAEMYEGIDSLETAGPLPVPDRVAEE